MVKLIRNMSDLHLEHGSFTVPPLDQDHETVLILAGDIYNKYKAVKSGWMDVVSKQFHSVIYVLGNHDHWTSSIDRTSIRIKEELAKRNIDNVYVLDNESIVIDGCRFIGSTLWTDYSKRDPMLMFNVSDRYNGMNDMKCIRTSDYKRRISADFIYSIHVESREFIKDQLDIGFDGPTYVVTHHAPCFLSIHDNYKFDSFVGCYYSDLTDIMFDYKIDGWFHGHVHDTACYVMHDVPVYCNPRGYYPDHLTPGFDALSQIKIRR